MKSILVLSAGRRVSLVRAFEAAARTRNIRVLTGDLDPGMSSACRIAEASFRLPHVLSDVYPAALSKLCDAENIALVVPTLDTELAVLARLRESMAQKGTHVVVSDLELVAACRDKRLTVGYFGRFGLRSPEIFNWDEICYPAIVKPVDGSLSRGIHILHRPEARLPELMAEPRNFVCEYLDPERYTEFTCDAYFTAEGALRCMVPRQRIEVRGGEVAKARTVRGDAYRMLCQHLSNVPGARGCLTIQVMYDPVADDLRLIEVNPRFGGGYPLTAQCGGTYHEWLIREYLEGDDIPFFEEWRDGLTMLRYDAEVFFNGK